MRTDTQKLALNRCGKPDVGQRPVIDDTINVVRDRIIRLEKKIRILAKVVKNRKTLNLKDFEEYSEVNTKLRNAKMEEAELVFVRNML